LAESNQDPGDDNSFYRECHYLREKRKQRLRVFEMACLRKVEEITRRDRIRNEEIFSSLDIRLRIIDRIRNKRLRYFGHYAEDLRNDVLSLRFKRI